MQKLKSKTAASSGRKQAAVPLITFFRAYPDALPVMGADRSALGSIPAQAYQYCEALTAASAFGWYAFPAAGLQLWFDGVDTYIAIDEDWQRLTSEQLPGMESWWNKHCPDTLTDMAPPFITSLGMPGFIQVWSGMLVETRNNWSVLVRSIANAQRSNQFFCFEGIVETDRYAPAPLFINLRLQVTNTIIEIPATEPLFQVQPIHRECYSKKNLAAVERWDIGPGIAGNKGMSDLNWEGYRHTVRSADPAEDTHTSGQYATGVRKRASR